MNSQLLANFQIVDTSIHATVIDRTSQKLKIFNGKGQSVQDAFSTAMSNPRLCFDSEQDEREACVAVMRGRSLVFSVNAKDHVFCHGFK